MQYSIRDSAERRHGGRDRTAYKIPTSRYEAFYKTKAADRFTTPQSTNNAPSHWDNELPSTADSSIADSAQNSNTDLQFSLRDSTEGDTAEETEERDAEARRKWDAALEKAAENGKSRKQSRTESKQAEAKTERAGKEKSAPASEADNKQYSTRDEVLSLEDVDWMDNHTSIKQQLQKHRSEIESTFGKHPIVEIQYGGETDSALDEKILEQALAVGDRSSDGKSAVFNRDGITFEFNRSGIRSIRSHAHANQGLRAASIISPYIAKEGIRIAGQKNHENTGLTTLTYAAPARINGSDVNVGVVIQFSEDGKPRAVNVETSDGGKFTIKNEETAKRNRGRADESPGTAPPREAISSVITIPRGSAESNTDFQYSIRDSTEGDTAEETEERVRSYSQLKADNAALKRQLERARREIRPTKEARVRRADAVKAAKKLLEGVNSAVTAQELADTIETMGNYVLRTDTAEETGELLRKLARESAQDIIGTAWEPRAVTYDTASWPGISARRRC